MEDKHQKEEEIQKQIDKLMRELAVVHAKEAAIRKQLLKLIYNT